MDETIRHVAFKAGNAATIILRIDVLTSAIPFIPEGEISQAVTSSVGARIVRIAALLNYKSHLTTHEQPQ